MTLLAILAGFLFALTAAPLIGFRTGSRVGKVVAHYNPLGPVRSTWYQAPAVDVEITFNGDSMTAVDLRHIGDPDPNATSCIVTVHPGVWWRSGWWAPTRESRTHRAHSSPYNGSPTKAQLAAARAHAVSLIDPGWGFTQSELAALAIADVHQSRTLWFGYAHDVVSLVLLAAFCVTFIRSASLGRRALIRRRIAAFDRADMCPRCRYSRVGIFGDVPCPECGEFGPNQRVRDLDRPID